MKFKLIIDEKHDEEIVATVKEKTPLIDYIQTLVEDGEDGLVGYYDNQIVKLNTNEIECIYTQDNKTHCVCSDNKTYLIKKRLYEVEKMLPPTFIRINKSGIANSKKIKMFITNITGSVNIEFVSGYTDYVSRRCFAEIRRRNDL